ncbi:MAG: metalloprotease TldD [Caulobacter sp.]|nr:metalloprotease TldD [Caulobacter sp.]
MTTSASHLDTASSSLLAPFDLTARQLETVFGDLYRHRLDYADLYFQYSRSEGWSLEEGIVKSGSFNIESGVGVRAISGEKTAFAYSDEISLPALKSAARATRAIAAQGTKKGQVPLLSGKTVPALYGAADPLASLPDTEKVKLLERLEGFARAEDTRVVEVMAHIAGVYEVVLIARSDGHLAADVRPLVRVSVTVIMQASGRREQGSSGGGGRFDYAYFTDAVLRDYAKQAVHQASVNLSARPAPAGEMTVVLGNGWPGILLHEAIGHGLEGDFNRKGSSAFAGRIGERVAARGVTVFDDGTIPGRRGSLTVDDEGTPTERTILIEDGILVGYMHDRMSARLMGLTPTGNARRESYAHMPMPRMTNTGMLGGSDTQAEMIASTKRGIFCAHLGGGQVDITNGKFVFQCTEAWMIENGKLTHPVKGASLIGDGPSALTRITMIGDDFAMDPGIGVCGKGGQGVPVGVAQPSLKVTGLTVGGTAV